MYNQIIIFILLMVSSLSVTAQKGALESLWRDSNIVINGDPSDWDQPFRYYDSKSKIQYCVANDATNIYICLKTLDDKAEMKILRTGMDVSVNATGKKKDAATIHFPLPGNTKLEWIVDPSEPDKQTLEHPDLKALKAEYQLADKSIQFTGFKNVSADKMPLENKSGIQVAIGWDRNNVFTYEAKIPFSTFFKDVITAQDTLSAITINVKANAFDVPQQITNGSSVTDPSVAGTGMRNQQSNNAQNAMMGGDQQSGQRPMMSMGKINDMSLAVTLQVRMRPAYR